VAVSSSKTNCVHDLMQLDKDGNDVCLVADYPHHCIENGNDNSPSRIADSSVPANHEDNLNCDSKGRCVYHPHNRLKKKK